jgi:hypothetical protein
MNFLIEMAGFDLSGGSQEQISIKITKTMILILLLALNVTVWSLVLLLG